MGFVVLVGDLNGRVGVGADGYAGVHGGYGYRVQNEEECRVLELADAHSMAVRIRCLRGNQHNLLHTGQGRICQ